MKCLHIKKIYDDSKRKQSTTKQKLKVLNPK